MTQQWKPISSAPKDGSLILLGCPDEGPDGRPALSLPGYWLKGWGDGPDDMGQDDGWVDVQYTDFYPGRSFGSPDYMCKGSQPTHWMPLPAAPGTPTASAQDEGQREGYPHDDPQFIALCREHDILGTAMQGLAAVFWRAASAQDDAKDERQAFEAWHKREFGDFMADAANHYNRWLGWQGHAFIAAPAAGDARDDLTLAQKYDDACIFANANARDAERYRWLRDQEQTDAIAIVMKNKHFDDSRTCAENIDQFIDAAIAAQQGKGGAA